jgi:hypothetical protein
MTDDDDDDLEPLWHWWGRCAWIIGWRLSVAVLTVWSLHTGALCDHLCRRS